MNNRRKNVLLLLLAFVLVATFFMSAGFAVWSILIVRVQIPAFAHAVPNPARASSIPSYPAETISLGEAGEHINRFVQKADYAFSWFDGELLGADRGEWGGELVFRDVSGIIHPLLKRNIRGIVQMPFGVIVFTGLAHLGESKGSIFRITRGNDGTVATTLLHDLRGPPSNLRWTTRGDLVFLVQYQVNSGLFSGAHTECLLLNRSGVLRKQLCLAIFDR